MPPTTHTDLEKIAKMAAKEAVSETFLTLGLDTKDPISVQNQFATLRNIHYGMRHVRNVIIAGVLGAAVSGGVWVFWTGFKASAAAPSTISAPGGH
uniref:Uncharacterized protein n=2 Tax=Bradyrhizobium quebecense TaxID=2748629 RepID=A0A973WRK2_9BRAD